MKSCRQHRVRTSVAARVLATLGVLGLAPAAASARPDTHRAVDRGSSAARVVGGTPVAEGNWKDAAAVYASGEDLVCTGVLVAPDVVLTAGHCADHDITHVKLSASDLDDAGEMIDVTQAISYGAYWATYDIAILMLASESTVEPRVIATGDISDRYLVDGAPVALVGYGATDVNATVFPGVLVEGFTTITDADCSSSSGCREVLQPDGELAAGGDGVDTCPGDSGGPLYLLTEQGEFLAGITSRAFEGSTLPCSEGGIYTRPDAVFDWIETESGRTLLPGDGDAGCGCRSGGEGGGAGLLVTFVALGLLAGRRRGRS